jgi:hypothetical protein
MNGTNCDKEKKKNGGARRGVIVEVAELSSLAKGAYLAISKLAVGGSSY